MRPKIFDLLFHDDRMFVLEVTPVTSRDGMSTVPEKREWAIVTRRNVPGYPQHRVDSFPTRAEAVAYFKCVVVETPRVSLAEKSPDPLPTIEAYSAWLVVQNLHDPILNPGAPRQTDA